MDSFALGGKNPVISVGLQQLDEGMPVPRYAHDGDAGMDLRVTSTVTLLPHETRLVGTGFAMSIPHGYYGAIVPRSGMATKHGVTVANTPGTVDENYRGEVKLALHNLGNVPVTVERGERVAQIIFKCYEQAEFALMDVLDDTDRGEGGFGSSGRD